jgi:hypothetical protein
MADDEEKKKPGLALVIGTSKKPDDATTDEDESSEDLDGAAGEMFDALKSDDRAGFIEAVKAVKAC